MIDLARAPFPVKYRELWLPRGINEQASLPSSRHDGHGLAFTGARRGTTVEGVHFDGSVTSNINCGAIHSNIPKLWVSFRFKLDQPFAAGVPADQYLWGKFVDATHYVRANLEAASGVLRFHFNDGGANIFVLLSTINSWDAGVWYHTIMSLSDVAGGTQRLLVDNTLEDSDIVAASNTPNGGDLVFGDYDDPGGGVGFQGVIADVFVGTDDLTANEEQNLYNGIPPWAPADTVNAYPLDEGRGVTAYDRGTGGNNGTLDTSATWAWGRVKQPVISLDGINDHAQSVIGADVSGAVTAVWAGKLKARYAAVITDHQLLEFFIDNNNWYGLFFNPLTHDFRWQCNAVGTFTTCDTHGFAPEIDDYCIFIGTAAGGVAQLFTNGVLDDTDTGLAAIAAGGITTYIGAEDTPAYWDVSKPLLVALIEGAFNQKQALAYSRFLNKIFNLGLAI